MARNLLFILFTRSHAFILITTLLHLLSPSSSQSPEADTLLRFKASLTENGTLSTWTNALPVPPCTGATANWAGVSCDEKGTVAGLQLPSMGLGGTIDVAALALLPSLVTLSLDGNNFTGPLPNLTGLPNVRDVYLSNNKLSGEIPANAFQGMAALTKLHLDNNLFSGPIPASLTGLPWLSELMLENNGFQGQIPQFPKGQLRNFSVANNALTGEIPYGLSSDASAFYGNAELCGAPLAACKIPTQRLSEGTIILLALLITAAFAALIVVIIILCRRRRHERPHHEQSEDAAAAAAAAQDMQGQDLEQGQSATANTPSTSPAGMTHQRKKSEPNVKITFLKEGMETFDMTDLLKASAEILGSGVFGSSYKAAVTDNQIVVVKRYRHMNNVSKQDFTEHMRRLGRLNHPNVLPLLGFYYRREEKLLVYQYVAKSSLASHLHGNRSRDGHKCPDWATRLSIAKGVARGLLYLHNELPSLTAAHGHLKSSNVLLDASFTPSLTDYGLVPIVNQEHAEQHMISYKSPEYKRSGRITKKTDVWSLGILVLEILTGRLFPSNFLKQGKSVGEEEAAAWAEAVAKDEEKGDEVFDADMAREKQCEGEMRKLLRIGFECCHRDVDMRPDIKEVAQQIEEVRERGLDEDDDC